MPPPRSTTVTCGKRAARSASSAPVSVQLSTLKTPLPVCACSPVTRTPALFVSATNSSASLKGTPNLEWTPPVRTWLVVAAAKSRIDAQKDLLAAKQLRPHLQRIQIVQSDAHALREADIRIRRAARNWG